MFPPKYHQNGGIFNVFVRLQEYHANTCMSQELSKCLVSKWVVTYAYNPLTNHLLSSWDIQVELSRQSRHCILYPLQVSHEIHTGISQPVFQRMFNCFHFGTRKKSTFFHPFLGPKFATQTEGLDYPRFESTTFPCSLVAVSSVNHPKDSYDLLRSEAVFLSPESRCPTWNEAVRRYVDVKRCLSSWRLGAVAVRVFFFKWSYCFKGKRGWYCWFDQFIDGLIDWLIGYSNCWGWVDVKLVFPLFKWYWYILHVINLELSRCRLP